MAQRTRPHRRRQLRRRRRRTSRRVRANWLRFALRVARPPPSRGPRRRALPLCPFVASQSKTGHRTVARLQRQRHTHTPGSNGPAIRQRRPHRTSSLGSRGPPASPRSSTHSHMTARGSGSVLTTPACSPRWYVTSTRPRTSPFRAPPQRRTNLRGRSGSPSVASSAPQSGATALKPTTATIALAAAANASCKPPSSYGHTGPWSLATDPTSSPTSPPAPARASTPFVVFTATTTSSCARLPPSHA